ncbi:Delta(14)-sterol reductase [Chamberlinius hualienensis]
MTDAEDYDHPERDFPKMGEAIIVKPTLTPEEEDRVRKAIQKKIYYGGPVGAMLLTVIMPLSTFALHFMCSKGSCSVFSWANISFNFNDLLTAATHLLTAIVIAIVSYNLPIGSSTLSEPMLNGDCTKVRLQARSLSLLLGLPFSLFFFLPFFMPGKYIGFQYNHIYDNFHSYVVLCTALSFLTSYYLYKRSFSALKSSLNIHANTGSPIYEFFMGRELQPTILGANAKFMIIGASLAFRIIIDVAIYQSQNELHGGYGSPTLLLAIFGNGLNVLDYVLYEDNYLTTMAMKHDGVGFKFVFTKLVLEPMLISYHARYILINSYNLQAEAFMIFIFACVAGCTFWHRFVLADKGLFSRDKNHAEVDSYDYILATNGKRLLVDGWWKNCRHPNYLCAICLSLVCCLVTGFSGILPYTYFIYLAIYNVYRIKQNEDLCRFEYGEAWDVYCKKVPYKLIKYIY